VAEVYSGYTNEEFSASGDRSEDTVLYAVTKGEFNSSCICKSTSK